MLSSVEQAFVGRDEIRALLKTPVWEAIGSVAAVRPGETIARRAKFWLRGKKAIFSCPASLEFISILLCFWSNIDRATIM